MISERDIDRVYVRLLQNPQNIQLRLELTVHLSSLRMLVSGTIPNSITNTQRAKLARPRVGSLAPSTFPTETKLYTTTESLSGEPFATTRIGFVIPFVSTTLLLEGPAELTEIRPSAGIILM